MASHSKFLAALASGVCIVAMASPAQAQTRNYQIAAGSLKSALDAYARQSGRQVIYKVDEVRGAKSLGAEGSMTAEDALDQLLARSGFAAREDASGAVAIVKSLGGNSDAVSAGNNSASSLGDDAVSKVSQEGISEILVVGSRSQNVDIQRTKDDPQPYIVFQADDIERSGAQNIEDFFRSRLNVNSQFISDKQNVALGAGGTAGGNLTNISLRGLDINQTLILLDGRRLPRVLSAGFNQSQGDIGGIPLSSIERIEVLPSSAGGIYGGGATGGVINIIRKRQYKNLDLRIGFDGTFRGGSETFRAELTGGFSANEGDTQISFSLAHSRANELERGANDLMVRGRRLYEKNAPGVLRVSGYTGNIKSKPVFDYFGCYLPAIQAGTPSDVAFAMCNVAPSLTLDNGDQLGATYASIPIGYGGVLSDQGAGLVDRAGTFNLGLSKDFDGSFGSLLAGPRTSSVNANLRQKLNKSIDAFLDVTLVQNRTISHRGAGKQIDLSADDPGNPFQQDITVFTPYPGLGKSLSKNDAKSTTYSIATGIIAKLSEKWSFTSEYNWSKSKTKYSSTVNQLTQQFYDDVRSGDIDIFRDLNANPIDYSPYVTTEPDTLGGPFDTVQHLGSTRVSGPLLGIWGGALKFTGLAEIRKEIAEPNRYLSAGLPQFGVPAQNIFSPRRHQTVGSVYAEVTVPLLSEINETPFVHGLELQFGLRHDRYRTKGGQGVVVAAGDPEPTAFETFDNKVRSTNYTVAGKYEPVKGLAARGSFATGFLPPGIHQLAQSTYFGTSAGQEFDPLRQEFVGTSSDYVILSGGNPKLLPEKSKSLSFGLILQPVLAPGLRMSADFTRIHKNGEIGFIDSQYILDHESDFPGRIVRANGQNGIPGPVISFDQSIGNIAKTRLKAWDFRVDYDRKLGDRDFLRVYGSATYQPTLVVQYGPEAAPFERAGFATLLKWRGNAGIDWEMGPWLISWNAQYYDSYDVRDSSTVSADAPAVQGQGTLKIPHQIYNDIVVRYNIGDQVFHSPLSNVELKVGIQNIFDKKPPVIADGFLGYSPYGDPRLRRFSISLLKSF